jgi:hypothetical protein
MEGAERPLLTAGSNMTSREQSPWLYPPRSAPPLQPSGHAEAEATGRGGRRSILHTCPSPTNQEGSTITNLMEMERLVEKKDGEIGSTLVESCKGWVENYW